MVSSAPQNRTPTPWTCPYSSSPPPPNASRCDLASMTPRFFVLFLFPADFLLCRPFHNPTFTTFGSFFIARVHYTCMGFMGVCQ